MPNALDNWIARAGALEAALSKAGRSALQSEVAKLRLVLNGARVSGEPAELSALAARVLGEVKACVQDKSRSFGRDLSTELDLALEKFRSAPSTPPESREWADMAFDSFAQLEDGDLASLANGVRMGAAAKVKDELGTLGESIAGGANVRVLMKGEIQPGLLCDLIQIFAQNAESGCLALEAADGLGSSIYFRDGKVIDAECQSDVGERGFFRAMGIASGRFSYKRGPEPKHVRIERSAQHLIMDTLRQMDEAN
jgi:hypothetical protein